MFSGDLTPRFLPQALISGKKLHGPPVSIFFIDKVRFSKRSRQLEVDHSIFFNVALLPHRFREDSPSQVQLPTSILSFILRLHSSHPFFIFLSLDELQLLRTGRAEQ